MIVTFCGHRNVFDPETVGAWLNEIVEELIREGANRFYLGGYGQFDALAAAVMRKQKERYPQILSVLMLPYICVRSSRTKRSFRSLRRFNKGH